MMMATTYCIRGKHNIHTFSKKIRCHVHLDHCLKPSSMESMTQTPRQLWNHHRCQVGFCTFLWDQLLNTVSRRLPR